MLARIQLRPQQIVRESAGVVLAWALLATSLLVGCAGDESVADAPLTWNGPNAAGSVIVVVNDTMRRDRVGYYGGTAASPRFDAFATDNLVFERAYTQAPWTKPSVASLFTSLHPSQHGVLGHPKEGDDDGAFLNDVLSDDFTTLAEVLAEEGFRTAAFVGNPWMTEPYGFAQGFDVYDDSFAGWDTPGRRVSEAALDWLGSVEPGERFFLYVHYMDCHQPYPPPNAQDVLDGLDRIAADTRELPRGVKASIPKPFKTLLRERGVEPSLALIDIFYDNGVESFDEALGVLLDGVDGHPAGSDTAIVVTSDHGEALFERGYGNHGRGLYEDEVAIPLAARFPGVTPSAPRRNLIGLVDIVPTVLTYLDVPVPSHATGASLFADGARATLVSEGVANKPANRAVFRGRHKLLWQPHGGPDDVKTALFDIIDDPLEERDLLQRAGNAEALIDDLLQAALVAVPARTVPESSRVPVDAEMQQRLRDLGYVK